MLAAVECVAYRLGVFWQPSGLLVSSTRVRGECGDAVKCSAKLAAPVCELAASQPPCCGARRQGMAQACTWRGGHVTVCTKNCYHLQCICFKCSAKCTIVSPGHVHTGSSRPSHTLGQRWLPPAHRPSTCLIVGLAGGHSGMHLAAVKVVLYSQQLLISVVAMWLRSLCEALWSGL